MDKYRVLRIDEDIDYGCEERQPGKKLMAVVTLEDQFGRRIQLKQEDQMLSEKRKRNMLHDKEIREPLFEFLEERYGKIRILEEKTMGKSRADIVMVTPDALYGIEIKSDADTYARLAGQVKDYDRYFDYNIAVAGSRHGLHICEHVPDYWGIITAEQEGEKMDFYFLRMPQPNPKVKWKQKLSLLWRPELAQIQEWNGMPKYKDKSRSFVCGKIVERIPEKTLEETLKRQVSDLLFERDYTKAAKTLADYRKSKQNR